jgi:hypothetical protein
MHGIEHARLLIRTSEQEAMTRRRMTKAEGRRENTFIYTVTIVAIMMLAAVLYIYVTGGG